MGKELVVRFDTPAIDIEDCLVVELVGHEHISRLFEYQLVLECREGAFMDEEKALTEGSSIVILEDGVEIRRIFGRVSSLHNFVDAEAISHGYRVSFVPRAWQVTLSETVDIFMDMSVPDIIKKVLTDEGFKESQDFDFRLQGSYPVREYVVQYQESDYNFINRLAEHVGIHHHIEHGDDRELLVWGDHNGAFKPIPNGDESGAVPYYGARDSFLADQRVSRLEISSRVLPKRYVVRDYNYRHPGVDLMADSEIDAAGFGDVIEYGTHFKTPDEGKKFARIRAEELRATGRVVSGRSSVPCMTAGATSLVEGHPAGDLELLLVEVRHHYHYRKGADGGDASEYSNEFRAIPKDLVYRPPRIAVKPVVPGMLTGVIDASARGQYAELDSDGRYRVKFLFDTAKRGEGQASRLVRMAQPHAGPGYGMHFPLRPGVEVLISCVNGDPDRPIIASTVPNPQTGSPVTAGNNARNVIRTGGGNEINIDDTEGSTRIKMCVPHADTIFQMGAPNAPEKGGFLGSMGNLTEATTGTFTVIQDVRSVKAAYSALTAKTSIVAFAGIEGAAQKLEKWAKLGSTVLKTAGDAVSTGTKIVGEFQRQGTDGAGGRSAANTKKELDKLKADAAARDARIRELENEIRMLRLEVPQLRSEAAQLTTRANDLRTHISTEHDPRIADLQARWQAAKARLDGTPQHVAGPSGPSPNPAYAPAAQAEASARAALDAESAAKRADVTEVNRLDAEATAKEQEAARKEGEIRSKQAELQAERAKGPTAAEIAAKQAQYERHDNWEKVGSDLGKMQKLWDARFASAVEGEKKKDKAATAAAEAGLQKGPDGSPLVSECGKILQDATKMSGGTVAKAAALAISTYSSSAAGLVKTGAVSPGEAWNLQLATDTAGVIGVQKAVVLGGDKLAMGGKQVTVSAAQKAVVHSPLSVELAGLARTVVSSSRKVDIISRKDILIGSRQQTKMAITKAFLVEGKDKAEFKFAKDWKSKSDSYELKVTKDCKTEAKTLDIKTENAQLTMKNNRWHAKAASTANILLDNQQTKLNKNSSMLVLKASDVQLKSGGTLGLKSSGNATLKASKILIG